MPSPVRAGGVVTGNTDAALRTALAGGGTVTFAGDGTITLTNGLSIASDTVIDGTGHHVTISGGGTNQIFNVSAGVSLTLKRLTVADGYADADFGKLGGALINSGITIIADCTFSNNIATGGTFVGAGGAISHAGTRLQISGSTFINNRAMLGGVLSCGVGDTGTGNIAITNCTFANNSAAAPDSGGAIWIDLSLANPVSIVNCTFGGNTNGAVDHVLNGIEQNRVYLANCIVADTVGGDGVKTIVDLGHNLSTDASAALTNATSLKNTDPMLGALTNNGGPTLTFALRPGSPALDAADTATAPATDQRGVPRPQGVAADIGAFEGAVDPLQPSAVHFAATNYLVGEQTGIAVIQLERTGVSSPVSVGFTAAAGTATDGVDFISTNVMVNFADGEMAQSVGIIILPDTTPEADETVQLSLHDPVGTVVDAPDAATLTIVDDDTGGQTITNLTDADLRSAMAAGGMIAFGADGSVGLTNPITVTMDTTLDGTGHAVTLSGNDAVRLFNVGPEVTLTLKGLILANGRVAGATSGPGGTGENAGGGAVAITNGTLNLVDCKVWTNTVYGGAGWTGGSYGSGGTGQGGAIYLESGYFNATNTEFAGNLARGGNGGTNTTRNSGPGETGGDAAGGVFYMAGGTAVLDHCEFQANQAIGGTGPQDGYFMYDGPANYGQSGVAEGGALFADAGNLTVIAGRFASNTVSTPVSPTRFVSGSMTAGGAIYNSSGVVALVGAEFGNNEAQGGAASGGHTSGDSQGGAVFNGGQMQLTTCRFWGNQTETEQGGMAGGKSEGGAVWNSGSLLVTQSLFQTNLVIGYEYTGEGHGGAIYSSADLTVQGSTFTGNAAQVFNYLGGGEVSGGAIYAQTNCALTNTTLAGNIAAGAAVDPFYPDKGGDAYGGALFCAGATLNLASCTLYGNQAVGGASQSPGTGFGGGICATNGTVNLVNVILATNTPGSNCFGTVNDLGHNLSSDASCNFSAAGSLNDTDPVLGPLGDYGGPTPTLPLLAGSPAIDAGDPVNYPATDQRGHARPYGSAPDIGAFESSPPFMITGRITGPTLVDEVAVGADTNSGSTTNGVYRLEGLAAGTYAVTPASPDYLFMPTNRMVTVGPDQVGVNFKAYHWNSLSLDGVTNGMLDVIFPGTNGATYWIQDSSNLVDWTSMATNTVGPDNFLELQIPITSDPGWFYRVVKP
ncbi:MAG TPA: choice-of-anchor Q domain-containing protein [Dongiaceae bacterium]|nr:choice-of-anchor Q domain-containing protein [Dongiaceae bacterium]